MNTIAATSATRTSISARCSLTLASMPSIQARRRAGTMTRVDPAQGLARQLARSVHDERVLDAVAAVPRHRFVPHAERDAGL